MLGDTHDDFYGARLVADARLHLSTIMNGQYSEPFFVTMCKIMSHKVYLGYKTFKGKEIKLKGIKDFFYSTLYGLGLRPATINIFLANCSKAAVNDKTQTQYSMRFIKWLREQDPVFKFPQELFELKRIRSYIAIRYKNNKRRRWLMFGFLEAIYVQKPHLLQDIGAGRKYKDVAQCCEENDIAEMMQTLKPIKLYKNPTIEQVRQLAVLLSQRLDKLERRTLIAKLIELYKADNDSKPDCDA